MTTVTASLPLVSHVTMPCGSTRLVSAGQWAPLLWCPDCRKSHLSEDCEVRPV